MREILFRGKRKSSGEWVYGNYCGAEYLTNEGIEHLIIEVPRSGSSAQVILETVGQYTGLTDKNGKKIFEGDIIKTKEFGRNSRNGVNFNDYDIFEVIYSSASFKLNNTHRMFIMTNGQKFEVIGNIHDNPDLLKGE